MTDKIDIDLVIDIDCYQCGTNISIPFRLGVQQGEYAYCQECQEGVEVINLAGTLSIARLEPRQLK